ncbi:hypothetical protein BsWGS_18430 [Bradybaena similaris]
MSARSLLAVWSMTVFLLAQCHGQEENCPDGWFGESCKYQCHCNSSATCLALTGECPPSDMCVRGYFGPGCQYYDLAYESSTQSYATDGDDRTCNPLTVATPIVIEWEQEHAYRWIRVVLSSPGQFRNFNLRLNRNMNCTNKRLFPVDEFTVDVYCTIFDPIDRLELYGRASDTVCSIYVTPGRNFALKQAASQSSEFPQQGQASNAVDGDVDSSLTGLSCTHTARQELPWWKVTLNRPYDLTSIYVYNRHVDQSRLSGFVATTYNGNTRNVMFRDEALTVTSVYKLNLVSTKAITTIELKQPRGGWMDICEMEAYGDAVCPDGTYGLDCEHDCACKVNESCSVATGACSSDPCPRGAYGYKCTQLCDRKCIRLYCMQNTGFCTYCPDGYTGDFCNLECSAGTYGGRCERTCSVNCLNTCDTKTGACDCKERYAGLRCNRCASTFYGENCTIPCSERCLNRTCEMLTGQCIACSRNIMGPMCNECVAGYFGPLCLERCPKRCLDKVCARDTGKCISCPEGFKGDDCTTECSNGTYGRNCKSVCSKDCKGICNKKTGECVCTGSRTGPRCDICHAGKFGPDCQQQCSAYCRDVCDHKTGMCSCAGHRAGLHCKDCQKSWYGADCSNPCSPLCSGKECDRVTGECVSCLKNRIMPECEECQSGWFGGFCLAACSSQCTNQTCNGVTGACFSCLGVRKGRFCQDCPAGLYGEQCNRACRGVCLNNTCDHVTGRCVACAAGYSGDLCTSPLESTSESKSPYILLMLLFPQAFIVFLCVVAFYQHMRSGEQPDKLNTSPTGADE